MNNSGKSQSKKIQTQITVDFELHEDDKDLPINKILSNRILNMSVHSIWKSFNFKNSDITEKEMLEEFWDRFSSLSYSDLRIMADDLTHQVERISLLYGDKEENFVKLDRVTKWLRLKIQSATALMLQIQESGYPIPKSTELKVRMPPFSLQELANYLTSDEYDKLLLKAAKMEMWKKLYAKGMKKNEADSKVAKAFHTSTSSIQKIRHSISSNIIEDPQ